MNRAVERRKVVEDKRDVLRGREFEEEDGR